MAEAEKLGITLEGAAAQGADRHVGERQQRLLRELETLALEHGQGARIGVEEVEAAAAPSAERQVWGLVDALVARDGQGATRAFLELRAQGETLPRLVPLMARRVRDVLVIATRLEAGESPAQVKDSLRMSPWAADRRIKEARATDAEALRRALEALADARGGQPRAERAGRRHRGAAGDRGDRRVAGQPGAERSGRAVAAQQARGAGLLAGAGVAMQGAALDGLVDRLHERAVLGGGRLGVAGGDRGLEAAEEGPDGRRVAAVLQALALGAEDALLL